MHTQIPLYIGITQYNKHYQWRLLVSYAVYSERRQRDKGGREVSAQKFYAFDFHSYNTLNIRNLISSSVMPVIAKKEKNDIF